MAKKKRYQKKWTCVLCGRNIYHFERDCVVGSTGRMVCKSCLGISQQLNESKAKPPLNNPKTGDAKPQILTPREIIVELDKAIIGQEKAKQAIAVALWKQQLRASGERLLPRMNMMLYGPTGCGKTAIVREASRLVGLPFITCDATTLTETGYRGKDATDIIKSLSDRNENNDKLPFSVVFLDECDKLAAQGGEYRQAYNRGTQHALLKLVEGVEVDCNSKIVSTDHMLFIFGGAFSRLKSASERFVAPIGFEREPEICEENSADDSLVSAFISYGMEPELMGRVGQYVAVEALTSKDLKQILLHSSLSALRQYQLFFQAHNIDFQIAPKCLDALIERAVQRKTGARGLNTLVEELVEPWLLRLANGELKTEKGIEVTYEYAE